MDLKSSPNRQRIRSYIYPLAILVILATLLLSPSITRAGQIVFNPDAVSVAIQTGDRGEVKFAPKLANLSRQSSYASFSLQPSSGNIPASWLSGAENIYLNGTLPANSITLKVSVPPGTATGTYRSVLRPSITRASERMISTGIPVYVEVLAKNACISPPAIDASAGSTMVRARNNKPLTFDFSGTISSPTGCTTEKAWYTLSDEYGEANETKAIDINDQGTFAVQISVDASRKGSDKDGRHYSISFGAENDAGIAISDPQSIIISHDNRK